MPGIRPWQSRAEHTNRGEPSLAMFYLSVTAGAYTIAAMFGYLAEIAASNGLYIHAAAHSAVAAFGTVTTTILTWRSMKPGTK